MVVIKRLVRAVSAEIMLRWQQRAETNRSSDSVMRSAASAPILVTMRKAPTLRFRARWLRAIETGPHGVVSSMSSARARLGNFSRASAASTRSAMRGGRTSGHWLTA